MFKSGKKIGNYTLVKPLGKGGFGEVWLAVREAKFVTTSVAVKLPTNEVIDPEDIKNEAVLWEKASGHPNVLPIIEADEYDNQIVIVSEYAADGSLENFLRKRGAMPVKEAVEMAIGIAKGLEFLHSRGIIHRDIKTGNILLQGNIPRLTDFGMSRLWMGDSTSIEVSGTPIYMAPEAFNRKRNEQTDIWSFGVVLYELLTNKTPFPGKGVAELYASILNREPFPLPDEIPVFLQKIIFKALEKSPEKRYKNMSEMLEDLQNSFARISGREFQISNTPGFSTKDSLARQSAETKDLQARTSKKSKSKTTGKYARAYKSNRFNSKKTKRKTLNVKYAAVAGILLILTTVASAFFFLRNPQPIPFRQGDKFGYSSWHKKVAIGAKYDLAEPFSENLGLVAIGNKDADGKFVGKYGFVDGRGREIVPLEYDSAESFAGELAKVGKFDDSSDKMLFGFINSNGEKIIPLKFEDAQSFSEKLAAVKSDGKWGFIDNTGTQIIPFQYDLVGGFSDNLSAFKLDDKYGFIDNAGNQIIAPAYDFAGKFSNGLAPVKLDGKAFFIDSKGSQAIRFKYNHANRFSGGFAMVTLNGKSGFIGPKGVEAIPFQYENENSVFSEGLADVRLNGKKGFIGKGGKVIIPFKYAEAEPFKNNLARVKTAEGKEFYIGYDGTEFYEP